MDSEDIPQIERERETLRQMNNIKAPGEHQILDQWRYPREDKEKPLRLKIDLYQPIEYAKFRKGYSTTDHKASSDHRQKRETIPPKTRGKTG